MAVSDDNLAGRLFVFLSDGRGIDGNTRVGAALGTLLKLSTTDQAPLLRRMARLVEIPSKLANELRHATELAGDDLDLHLRWKSPVEASFSSLNLAATWGSVIQHINNDVLQNLEFCDHLLHRRLPEKRLPPEPLSGIRADLEALLEETVNAPHLDKTVKQLILTHVRALLEALDDYPISGSPPFEYAVQAAVGTVIINQTVYTSAGESDRTALQKFLKVVRQSAIIVSFTLNVLQLPPAMAYYLPLHPDEPIRVMPTDEDPPESAEPSKKQNDDQIRRA